MFFNTHETNGWKLGICTSTSHQCEQRNEKPWPCSHLLTWYASFSALLHQMNTNNRCHGEKHISETTSELSVIWQRNLFGDQPSRVGWFHDPRRYAKVSVQFFGGQVLSGPSKKGLPLLRGVTNVDGQNRHICRPRSRSMLTPIAAANQHFLPEYHEEAGLQLRTAPPGPVAPMPPAGPAQHVKCPHQKGNCFG